jgi:hypothetical protein
MEGKTILLVLCGSPARRTVLASIAAMNIRIVCLNPSVAWANDLVHQWIIAPCDDREASLSCLQKYIAETNETFDGIVCYDEFGLSLAAILASAIGISFFSVDTVEISRDKFRFRGMCTKHGIPSPKVVHLDPKLICDPAICSIEKHKIMSLENFNANISHVASAIDSIIDSEGLSFPVVIKPTHGAGKMCTRKASTALEVAEAICMMHSRVNEYVERWSMTFEEVRSMVLEEFLVGGPEVDVDCLVQKVTRVCFYDLTMRREKLFSCV